MATTEEAMGTADAPYLGVTTRPTAMAREETKGIQNAYRKMARRKGVDTEEASAERPVLMATMIGLSI